MAIMYQGSSTQVLGARHHVARASGFPVHRRWRRPFSWTGRRRDIGSLEALSNRTYAEFHESSPRDLLFLKWPSPPRNILLVKKEGNPPATESLIAFAKHIASAYHPISVVLEPHVASELHQALPFSVYTTFDGPEKASSRYSKVDVAVCFGGDGTILHAASLFAASKKVPPLLPFSMGTLGFLGEWKFDEYKRAFREAYMSGAGVGDRAQILETTAIGNETSDGAAWSSTSGRSMGRSRGANVLLRSRLQVDMLPGTGDHKAAETMPATSDGPVHAMNEVIIHRGKDPHLAVIDVFIGGRFLTEAVADGMIISTPTGSTAYSLSSGGSIVHPLVPSILLTPVCPRSLSFRPLVLPANAQVTLQLGKKHRGREVEVSIDGRRRDVGMGFGMSVQVSGERLRDRDGAWCGGVPCIMRGDFRSNAPGDDSWVGGLNGLLKFNYPFGEE